MVELVLRVLVPLFEALLANNSAYSQKNTIAVDENYIT